MYAAMYVLGTDEGIRIWSSRIKGTLSSCSQSLRIGCVNFYVYETHHNDEFWIFNFTMPSMVSMLIFALYRYVLAETPRKLPVRK